MNERKGHPPTAIETAPKPQPQGEGAAGTGYFSPAAASILLSVFKPGAATTPPAPEKPAPQQNEVADPAPTTASVKFMITTRDEQELRALGYSQEQIDKLKPSEVATILENGTPPDAIE